MKHFTEYNGHVPIIIGQRKVIDNTIMTFDIETTSYLILDGKIIPASEYLKLTKEEQERTIYQSNMYIWMFSIGDQVYYGRTWSEFDSFLQRIEHFSKYGKQDVKHIVYSHNFSFEFQHMRSYFEFEDVFARKSRHVIKAKLKKYNIEFRCSLMMTNTKLEKLPEIYGLLTEKLVGNLDYSKIRNSKTELTEKEMSYCENDCLVLYEYIKKELLQYLDTKHIPLTQTGHVRRELKDTVKKDWKYLWTVRRSISADPHVYNLLVEAFAGRIYSCKLDTSRRGFKKCNKLRFLFKLSILHGVRKISGYGI